MKKLTLFAALTLAAPLFSQSTNQLVSKHWGVSKELTLAVAEAMPAESYNFRPNSEEMSFGQLMVHIAVANNAALSTVAGEKAPALPEKLAKWRDDPNVDKAAAVAFMKESFDYCLAKLGTVTADQLNGLQGPEGRQLLGSERIWSYFTHTAHHRGQAEVYLRVKNIKPPTYKF